MSLNISLEEFEEIERRQSQEDIKRLVAVIREHFNTHAEPAPTTKAAPKAKKPKVADAEATPAEAAPEPEAPAEEATAE